MLMYRVPLIYVLFVFMGLILLYYKLGSGVHSPLRRSISSYFHTFPPGYTVHTLESGYSTRNADVDAGRFLYPASKDASFTKENNQTAGVQINITNSEQSSLQLYDTRRHSRFSKPNMTINNVHNFEKHKYNGHERRANSLKAEMSVNKTGVSLGSLLSKRNKFYLTNQSYRKRFRQFHNEYSGTLSRSVIHLFRRLRSDGNPRQRSFSSSSSSSDQIIDIINPHEFSYIHNPKYTCIQRHTTVLLVSPSSAADFNVRQKIRALRMKVLHHNDMYNVSLLFFLGLPTKDVDSTQKLIDKEAERYKDIVQETFVDSYRNLTLKSVAMLKWVTSFCLTSTFVIKSDTDVDITTERLIAAMYRQQQIRHTKFVIGNLNQMGRPYRDSDSKWYVPYTSYSAEVYPTFALGPTYGYTTDSAPYLYNASTRLPFFFLEDVFVTGMCARAARIPLVSDAKFSYRHFD